MSTEDRLAKLERSQRWLRGANVVLVGLVLALSVPCCTGRNDIPAVIRARSFEVVDDAGEVRGRFRALTGFSELQVGGDGEVRGYFRGGTGFSELRVGGDFDDARVSLTAGADARVKVIAKEARTDLFGGGVCIASTPDAPKAREWFRQFAKFAPGALPYQEDIAFARQDNALPTDPKEREHMERGRALVGKPCVQMGCIENGRGAISTHNGKGNELVWIGCTTTEEGAIRTRDAKGGQDLVSIGAGDGGGMIATRNAKGKELVSIGATKGGGGAISTHSADGKELVSIGATKGGDGTIFTRDAKGKNLVSISAGDGGGGLVSVYNVFGSEVAGMQSNKQNCGMVFVQDTSGNIKQAISGSR